MARPFLTARWKDLAIISYAVPRESLAGLVPPGCELDEHPAWPGQGLVSLVAFDFADCCVKGVKWRLPWMRLVNFPEINLRFYVRGPRGRGVCFIREYVPSRLIGVVARVIYNEPYRAARMRSTVGRRAGATRAEHLIEAGGRQHRIVLEADSQARAQPTEVETFFKEHRWGYGMDRRGRTVVYEVRHPPWATFHVRSAAIDVDFAALYGQWWGRLNGLQPVSCVLAAGSVVEVWPCARG